VIFHAYGEKNLGPIWPKFCTGEVSGTCSKFGDDRLRGFSVAKGHILGFSIGFCRRPYNTVALPCECAINSCHYPELSAREKTSLSKTPQTNFLFGDLTQCKLLFVVTAFDIIFHSLQGQRPGDIVSQPFLFYRGADVFRPSVLARTPT